MMHYGHMNAFRQGRGLGTHLVVGINSDESIRRYKGSSPVMTDEERTICVQGCKFVDEIVPECPYVMDAKYLEEIVFGKYKVDYVVHGDDACRDVDGNDVYESAKRLDKYRSVPRTEGVSTTDIVGRMLLLTKTHHKVGHKGNGDGVSQTLSQTSTNLADRKSKFLTTNRMLRVFSAGYTESKSGDTVIYVDGAWDMFHAGHVKFLERCKAKGDYLIVGIHNDQIVNKNKGSNLPILNLHERVLSVLGCRHVDDVLIDCPWIITEQMMKSLRIDLVVSGTHGDNIISDAATEMHYEIPRKLGKFEAVTSYSNMDVPLIAARIKVQEQEYTKKIAKKKKAEEEYYKERYNLGETDPDSNLTEESLKALDEETKKSR